MAKLTQWWARSKVALTSDEVVERLKKIERALELEHIERPQSEVDRALSQGAAELIKAFENSSTAVAQLGSLLIVKMPDRAGSSAVMVRNLSQRELIFLENNPELLTKPAELLAALTRHLALPRGSEDRTA